MMTYIYIATYAETDIYLYVGSHTWKGPEGQLDPSYHGSSRVANKYNWLPVDMHILEIVSEDRKLIAERYWIEKYAEKYGIADCAAILAKSKSWISKFPRHGRMLNCHANDASQATEASRAKILAEGKTERQKEADMRNLDKAVQWYKEHLKDDKFYQEMCSKAAYARACEQLRKRLYGPTNKQLEASTKRAVALNEFRREHGTTVKQIESATSNVIKGAIKRHELSTKLTVTDIHGNEITDHCKELSLITGLNYGTLRKCKSDLEAGKDFITFKRGKYSGWRVKLDTFV